MEKQLPESPQETLRRVRRDTNLGSNFFRVYSNLRNLPESSFSIIITSIAFTISIAYLGIILPTDHEIKGTIILITSNGLNYSVTTLGFVMAAFTIFLSVTNREFFIKLATLKHPTLRINFFRYTISLFYNIFLLFGTLYFSFLVLNVICNDPAFIRFLKTHAKDEIGFLGIFAFIYCNCIIALSISYITSTLLNVGRIVTRSIVDDISEDDVLGYPK